MKKLEEKNVGGEEKGTEKNRVNSYKLPGENRACPMKILLEQHLYSVVVVVKRFEIRVDVGKTSTTELK